MNPTAPKSKHLLLVEDAPGDARLVVEAIRGGARQEFSVEVVVRLAQAIERMGRGGVDLVLLDLGLPDTTGLDTLRRFRAGAPNVPVVVFTVIGNEETGVEAVRLGAQDYLVKEELNPALLARTCRHAIERWGIQTRLAEEETRWRSLVENAPYYVVLADGESRITYVNRVAAGIDPTRVLGSSVYEWVEPAYRDVVRLALQAALEKGETGSVEVQGVGPNRSVRWYETRVVPLARGGSTQSVMLVAMDVTDQREAASTVLKAIEQKQELARLQELDAFKTSFLNVAAHELNTPLTPIMLQLHLLKRSSPAGSSPPFDKALDILDRNVARLASLVQDLLDSARLQSGHVELERRPVRIDQLVQEALQSFEEVARQGKLKLESRVEAVPEIPGDARRLNQVVFNLLSNATKFTPPGGRVRVSVRAEGGKILVEVQDTGAGIAPEDVPKLFQPFSQVGFLRGETRAGTGLGLYISRGLVAIHGGEMWCQSPGLGKGSTFGFSVPLAAAGAGRPDTKEAPSAQPPRARS